jgi:isopropylmalate/homocitrate/citramalate synthase
MPKIYIMDVTNRDGVQTAKLGLPKLAKTMINLYLNEVGVFQSEFGFPTTRHESNYLDANLELAELGILQPIRLGGWIRAQLDDVEATFKLTPRIKHLNLSLSTSGQMLMGKFQGRKTQEDLITMMTEAVDAALARGAESVGVNAEDASRTDLDFLVKFGIEAKKHGACRLRYCDTLGYDNPFTIYETIRSLAKRTQMPIEIHCHGDLGMAEANSLAGAKGAIDGGQDVYINTTVNGIGERAGNADLIATVLALKKSKGFAHKYKFGMPIDMSKFWKISTYASYAFKVPIPINHPGIGANAFAHASGIHADGVLKDPHNYELYSYTELGRGDPISVETGREICSGEYGGTSGFYHIMEKITSKKKICKEEEVEIKFRSKSETDEILELVRYANVESQKPLVEDELMFIYRYPATAKKLLTLAPLLY